MPKKTIETTEEVKSVVEGTEEVKKTEEVIYFKATRGLTTEEHAALSEKLRYEKKNTGLKIILVPFLLDIADGEVID